MDCVLWVYVYTVYCKAQATKIHNLYSPNHLLLYIYLNNSVSVFFFFFFCKYHINMYTLTGECVCTVCTVSDNVCACLCDTPETLGEAVALR